MIQFGSSVAFKECVWGVAYEIATEDVDYVVKHLDYREKGGYKAVMVTFYPAEENEPHFDLKIYIGTEDNPYFLGPAPMEDLAHQIYTSVGPSGPNTEYLFQLADVVRELMPHVEDKHLFELEHLVKKMGKHSNQNASRQR